MSGGGAALERLKTVIQFQLGPEIILFGSGCSFKK